MTPLLEVSGLSVTFTRRRRVNRAVSDASFTVGRGEVVGIVGESGSGKSTATLAALGLTRQGGEITAGSVRLDGRELLGMSDAEWRTVRGARIGLVTQNPRGALSPVATVGDQIMGIYRAHRPKATRAEARERAIGLLRRVGINDPERRMDAFPGELSGGMAQRVVIAMGLVCDPELLIADEPTSGLDVTVQAQVLNDLRDAAARTGSSLLIVTQDLSIVASYCDRVYLLHAGEVLEEATTAGLFEAPSSPATVALLAAQRRVDTSEVRLQGFPVDGHALPAGCWLAARCPFVTVADGCHERHPALEEAGPGHLVRCHRREAVRAKAGRLFADHTAAAAAASGKGS